MIWNTETDKAVGNQQPSRRNAEGSTTREQSRRAKRSEAPSFPKGNDDMVSSLVKAKAARKGGIEGRASMRR